ncbi:hypothetical protein M5689_009000 [Euphorbia peplus]|nr:hypothetical protein M5689_009000 [Euphorbia peplus]
MEEDPQKPVLPISHSDQNESGISETELVKKEEAEIVIPVKKEEKMSRRRKIRRMRRKILGEIDLGINYYELEQNLKCCGTKQHFIKMPPLSDGMAMKQHLKSWAYAVACTVR